MRHRTTGNKYRRNWLLHELTMGLKTVLLQPNSLKVTTIELSQEDIDWMNMAPMGYEFGGEEYA